MDMNIPYDAALGDRSVSRKMMQQTRKPKVPDFDFLTLTPGDMVSIGGVLCRLQNINCGKRRLTFVPVSPQQKMPAEETRNPITKVHKKESQSGKQSSY